MVGTNAPVLSSVRIEFLFISGGHMYFGRHGLGPLDFPAKRMDEVECVAGRGITGDRFFLEKSEQKRQITFFSMEVYESMCRELNVHDRHPSVLRRNVFVRGADLGSLIASPVSAPGRVLFEGSGGMPAMLLDGPGVRAGGREFPQGPGRPAGANRGKWRAPDLRGVRKEFSAVLMAGGASSRMGTPKALVRVGGEALWRRQVESLKATGPGELMISPRGSTGIQARASGPFYATGPLASAP